MIQSVLLFLTLVNRIHPFEIFIKNPKDDSSIEPYQFHANRTYQMGLFQTRLINIRIHPDHLRRDGQELIGFKFQVQSSNARAMDVRKELPMLNSNPNKTILLEDLFILPHKNALEHIFNAYPSPTLMNLKIPLNIDIVWSIKTIRMEETNLTFYLDVFYTNQSSSSYAWRLNVFVTQPKRTVDRVFQIVLPFLVIFISIQMGILLDTTILIELVKRPKPVLIGFVSQYGLMPFLAMAIAKIFRYTPLYSLALFVIGCCPGSGASNQWTLLFDGDVNLSAVMSFVSTASSFIMMPLYFYTFGRIYMDELSIRVPFLGLVRSLALVVLPYSIGIGISHCSPKTRLIVQKLVKPMMLFLLLFFLVFGTIVNWYLIETIDLRTALTAPLLPYLGFLFGGLLAWICGLNWSHVKTIGIEAGIQNVGIAFMIIYYSFPQPYATQAIVVPLVVAFLTTKPFWLVYVIRNRLNRYKKSKQLENQDEILPSGNEKPPSNCNEENNPNKNKDTIETMQNL